MQAGSCLQLPQLQSSGWAARPVFLLIGLGVPSLSHAGHLGFRPDRFGEHLASEDVRTWPRNPQKRHDGPFGCMEAKLGAH
jgi:hypothetical protein